MGKKHGPRCECKEAPQVEQKQKAAGDASEFLTFPVVVADGRNLQIQWMHGEDPMQVAASSAHAHGIHKDELAAIVEFVRHADEVTCRSAPCEPSTDRHPPGLHTTVDKTGDECKNGDKEAEKEQNRKEQERKTAEKGAEKEEADAGQTLEPVAEPVIREADVLNPQI